MIRTLGKKDVNAGCSWGKRDVNAEISWDEMAPEVRFGSSVDGTKMRTRIRTKTKTKTRIAARPCPLAEVKL